MKEKYPLEELLKIKLRRFDQAVKIFEEKSNILLKEQENLFQKEQERDSILSHKIEKLTQLNQEFNKGISSSKIEQMNIYLDTIEEKLKEQQKKVDAQKKVVDNAEKEMEQAKKVLFEKKKELEKINMHKDEWKQEMLVIEKRLEEVEQDEIGATRDILRKYEERKQKRSL